MARQIKLPKGREFHFTRVAAGAESKYPWDNWFQQAQEPNLIMLERDGRGTDGKVQKRDFDAEVDAMPGKIKSAARRKYKVVKISRHDPDGKKMTDGLIIQCRDMTDEERKAEDALRAAERQKNKQRLLEAKEKAKAERMRQGTTIVEGQPGDELEPGEEGDGVVEDEVA